ncbi:hypothetical protein [Citreimonas salinaria]|uniref:Glyceraldehyde-3-phosphate dehydrogenase n=1 Tax=Citreimonas salinaria TaxID=321339 RepID=A0A1H3IJT1_9RHOB|nr:hypothetical protein [Citreimonas salinaria]SDY27094.1 hypothetical protein SAMN05444340_10571 [Citreimonas salinaria]
MTTRLALILGAVVLAAIAADLVLSDGRALLFLARKLLVLIDWMAFWR